MEFLTRERYKFETHPVLEFDWEVVTLVDGVERIGEEGTGKLTNKLLLN